MRRGPGSPAPAGADATPTAGPAAVGAPATTASDRAGGLPRRPPGAAAGCNTRRGSWPFGARARSPVPNPTGHVPFRWRSHSFVAVSVAHRFIFRRCPVALLLDEGLVRLGLGDWRSHKLPVGRSHLA